MSEPIVEPTLYEPRDEQVVVAAAPELRLDPRFTQHMLGWFRGLASLPLAQAIRDPRRGAIVSSDLIVGFTHEGRLASRGERAAAPFVFTGTQILAPRLFSGERSGAFSLKRLYDHAESAGRLFGLVHDGAWLHVGTPAALADAERALRSES